MSKNKRSSVKLDNPYSAKPVIAIDIETGKLWEFSSITGALVFLKNQNEECTAEGIRRACRGISLKYKGFYWSLVE